MCETIEERLGAYTIHCVTDINLYATTLRFAATNEICTIRNGDLCTNKIVNCNRSAGASIVLRLVMHMSLMDGDNYEVFSNSFRNYVDDRPQDWDSVMLIRCENFDGNMEQVTICIALRHRNSWQSAARILQDRGILLKFLYDKGEGMGVNYNSAPATRLIYDAGILKDGGVPGYGRSLLAPGNIINRIKED
jgi:hypothetical protein